MVADPPPHRAAAMTEPGKSSKVTEQEYEMTEAGFKRYNMCG